MLDLHPNTIQQRQLLGARHLFFLVLQGLLVVLVACEKLLESFLFSKGFLNDIFLLFSFFGQVLGQLLEHAFLFALETVIQGSLDCVAAACKLFPGIEVAFFEGGDNVLAIGMGAV